MSFVGLKLISEFCEFIISTLTPKRFDCDKPFGLVVRCLYFRIETMNKNVSVQGNRWRLSVARKNVSTHINWCHQQNTRTQLSSQLRTHIHIQTPRIDWLCSFLFATITKSSNNPSNIFIDMSISGIRINNRIAAKSLIRKQTKKKKSTLPIWQRKSFVSVWINITILRFVNFEIVTRKKCKRSHCSGHSIVTYRCVASFYSSHCIVYSWFYWIENKRKNVQWIMKIFDVIVGEIVYFNWELTNAFTSDAVANLYNVKC